MGSDAARRRTCDIQLLEDAIHRDLEAELRQAGAARRRPAFGQRIAHRLGPRAALRVRGDVQVVLPQIPRRQERRLMTDLADAMERAWAIVHCMCTDTTARQRLEQRQREGLDPSEADQIVRDRVDFP